MNVWLSWMFAASAAPSAPVEPLRWPLESGHRWTYTDERGETGLVLDARGDGRVEVRGPSIFWGSSGFVLEQKGDDWRVLSTESYLGPDVKPTPWLVLDGPPRAGHSWAVHQERDDIPFAFRVEIVGREPLTLPVGQVDAWHVRYILTAHLGTEHDVDLWFADGFGLVQLERVAESTLGEKSSPAKRQILELARFEQRGAETAASDAPDDALQARITVTGTGKVGEPLPLRFGLVNQSTVPVRVLPALDASDVGWRYPKIEVRLIDPDGVEVGDPGGRCGLMNTLNVEDLRVVRPSEEFDPFGPGSFAPSAVGHLPDKRGTWTVRFVYDTRGKDGWEPIDPAAQALIGSVPHGVTRAEATFEVK